MLTAELNVSRPALWTGRAMTALVVLFMLFDAVLHLLKPSPVATSFAQLGYPLDVSVGLGVVELICVALYVIPRTAVWGSILLTGYLGGAAASQLRVGHSFFEVVFPVILGLLAWGGLLARDARLRAALLGAAGSGR